MTRKQDFIKTLPNELSNIILDYCGQNFINNLKVFLINTKISRLKKSIKKLSDKRQTFFTKLPIITRQNNNIILTINEDTFKCTLNNDYSSSDLNGQQLVYDYPSFGKVYDYYTKAYRFYIDSTYGVYRIKIDNCSSVKVLTRTYDDFFIDDEKNIHYVNISF